MKERESAGKDILDANFAGQFQRKPNTGLPQGSKGTRDRLQLGRISLTFAQLHPVTEHLTAKNMSLLDARRILRRNAESDLSDLCHRSATFAGKSDRKSADPLCGLKRGTEILTIS